MQRPPLSLDGVDVTSDSAEVKVEEEDHGVFYAGEDYAGILTRLFVLAVDGTVLALLACAVILASTSVLEYSVDNFFLALLVTVIVWYVYMAVLKITPVGTLGYALAGVKLVDLRGRRASVLRSSIRFGFIFFGPLNALGDVIWLGGERDSQSFRDKFAGTYVVKKHASPAGEGPIETERVFLSGYSFIFRKVQRAQDF